MTRCYNDKDPAFARYGAKGIKVCRRWHDVRNFVNDMERTYRKGLQIDRKNNNCGYSPANCRWVTPQENIRNRRTTLRVHVNGVKTTVAEAAELFGLEYATLVWRIKNKPRSEWFAPVKPARTRKTKTSE